MDWGGPVFIRVSKKRYENFCRYFKSKLEFNDFMGWNDAYDFSYDKHYQEKLCGGMEENHEYLGRCKVARHFFETPQPEYYIRVDYIWFHNYDLNTVVPKPRKKKPKLSKTEKMIVDHMCDAFDIIFRQEALTDIIDKKGEK